MEGMGAWLADIGWKGTEGEAGHEKPLMNFGILLAPNPGEGLRSGPAAGGRRGAGLCLCSCP